MRWCSDILIRLRPDDTRDEDLATYATALVARTYDVDDDAARLVNHLVTFLFLIASRRDGIDGISLRNVRGPVDSFLSFFFGFSVYIWACGYSTLFYCSLVGLLLFSFVGMELEL